MYIRPLALLVLLLFSVGCAQKNNIAQDDFIQAVKLDHKQAKPQVIQSPPKVVATHQLKTFGPGELNRSSKSLRRPSHIIRAANALATRRPDYYGYFNAIMTYDYAHGALYQVFCAPFKLTDIQLQPGEEISGKPGIGDPVRWKAGASTSIEKGQKVQHLYIKPTRPSLDTTLILTTNRRTYHIELHSYDKTYMSAVSWNYADDGLTDITALDTQIEKENAQIESSTVDLTHANFNYTIDIDEGRPIWTPVRAFDNGQKTFIQFPDALAVSEAPALFVTKDDDLQLVNYRVKNNFYIVDRLFNKAELRIVRPNYEEIVIVTNGNRS